MFASFRSTLFLIPLLALSGCSNDGAAYRDHSARHAISVERKKDYFWEKNFQYSIIVSRLPSCQRKHRLQSASPNAVLELWQTGSNTFILRIGQNLYLAETQTCEGFSRLEAEPPGGYGRRLGTFGMTQDTFRFTAATPEPPETEAPAPESGNPG